MVVSLHARNRPRAADPRATAETTTAGTGTGSGFIAHGAVVGSLTMDAILTSVKKHGGLTMDSNSSRAVVLIEVFMELDRTFEQLGSEATRADYAADVIRRLTSIYETEV